MAIIVRRSRTLNVIPLIFFTFIAPTPLFLRWIRWRSRCTRWRRGGLLHGQLLEVLRRYIVSSHLKRTVYGSAHLLSAVLSLLHLDVGYAYNARAKSQPGEELAERVV